VAQKCPHFFSQIVIINCEKKRKSKKHVILANCLDFLKSESFFDQNLFTMLILMKSKSCQKVWVMNAHISYGIVVPLTVFQCGCNYDPLKKHLTNIDVTRAVVVVQKFLKQI